MPLQLANINHPNSPQNTMVFCACEASDTPTNLHIALDRYQTQIETLNHLEWEPGMGVSRSSSI